LISNEADSSWSKIDPFIDIQCGNEQSIKTSIVSNGGHNCKWEDTIIIEFEKQYMIQFELYDKSTFGKD